jgi:hypothetical protein
VKKTMLAIVFAAAIATTAACDSATGAVGKADIFCVLTNITAPANIAIEISQTAAGKIGNDA